MSTISENLVATATEEAKTQELLTVLLNYVMLAEVESFFDAVGAGDGDVENHPYHQAAKIAFAMRLHTNPYIMQDVEASGWIYVQPEKGATGIKLSIAAGYSTAAEAWEDNLAQT